MEWFSLSLAEYLWLVLAGLIVLVLPGAALWVWLPVGPRDWLERLADAVGLSVGLTVLVGLGAHLLGVVFSLGMLVTAYGICLFVLAVGLVLHLPDQRSTVQGGRWGILSGVLAGLPLLAALLGWRWFQARSLLLPAWVDSVHHTLVVKKILELGAIPATLGPEIQAPFAFHFGFHLLAALFSELTEIAPAHTVLWFGQALNGLIALSVYRLGKSVWGDWRPAGLAALLVGFAFQMPAYYLTWGRYTLSTGLVVLPLAMAAGMQAIRPSQKVGLILHLLVLTAGVALTHLTTLLLFGFFIILLLTGSLLKRFIHYRRASNPGQPLPERETSETAQPRSPLEVHAWIDGLWQPVVGSVAGLALSAPWLVYIWQNQPSAAGLRVVSLLDTGQADYWQYILFLLGPQHNYVLLGLAGIGLVWALMRPAARTLAVWSLLLSLLTLPWGLRIAPFRPDHMAILLFLPAALLLSGLILDAVRVAGKLSHSGLRRGVQTALVLGGLGLVLWGGWRTRDVINPVTVLITQADLNAIHWVETNTPQDARFMINTAYWMSGSYRGVDGGYWLSVLTGRTSLLPPALYTLAEREWVLQISNWAERAAELVTCDSDFWQLVKETGSQYVYVRQGQGSLQPAALAACDGLLPVYRRDGVFIYEIVE